MKESRRVVVEVMQFLGGVGLLYASASWVVRVWEVMGWVYLAAPVLFLAGFVLVVEASTSGGKKHKQRERARRALIDKAETTRELEVLRAASLQGALSVESAALATGMPLAEARLLLRRLEQDGYATSEVDEQGCQWFAFPGLSRPQSDSVPSPLTETVDALSVRGRN